MSYTEYLDYTINTLKDARSQDISDRLDAAVTCCVEATMSDKPILACGNGGSAADCEHIVGELIGRFKKDRRPVKAISLVSHSAMISAWCNDVGFDTVFARQVQAFGTSGGVLLALSTSGASQNVIEAAKAAKSIGMSVIAFTGADSGLLGRIADVSLAAPSSETPIIQQVHECWYHFLCLQIEDAVASDDAATGLASHF